MADQGDSTVIEAAAGMVAGEHITLSGVADYDSFHPSWSSNQPQDCWAITNLKAPFYEPSARAPVDIVAVIDKSGSMRGSKIELVRKTLLFVIDQCECRRVIKQNGWGYCAPQ